MNYIAKSLYVNAFLVIMLTCTCWMLWRSVHRKIKKQYTYAICGLYIVLVYVAGFLSYVLTPFDHYFFDLRCVELFLYCGIPTFLVGAIVAIAFWIIQRCWISVPLKSIITAWILIFTVTAFVYFSDFTIPVNRPLEPELYRSISLPQAEESQSEKWQTFYKDGPDHSYMNPSLRIWNESDLETYTYIVSYEKKITSVSYNIWEYDHKRDSKGSFAGYVTFSEESYDGVYFVYRIPAVRLHNAQ